MCVPVEYYAVDQGTHDVSEIVLFDGQVETELHFGGCLRAGFFL